MQEQILSLWTGLKDKWKEQDKQRQIKIIIAAASVLLVLSVAIYLVMRPNWVALTQSAISPSERLAYEGVLSDNKIPYKNTKSGTGLQVRQKDKEQATIQKIISL